MILNIDQVTRTNDAGPYTAYYLYGDYSLDNGQIFLGVARASQCLGLRGKSHVSFVQYQSCIEISDGIFPTDKVLKAFEFYAEYVDRIIKEHEKAIINGDNNA